MWTRMTQSDAIMSAVSMSLDLYFLEKLFSRPWMPMPQSDDNQLT